MKTVNILKMDGKTVLAKNVPRASVGKVVASLMKIRINKIKIKPNKEC